jgi:hypothetical protein
MCSKVAQEVMEVGREVLPGRAWYAAIVSNAELNQPYHSFATARQRLYENRPSNPTQVDQPRHLDAMTGAEVPDPTAAAVVDVRSDHPDR